MAGFRRTSVGETAHELAQLREIERRALHVVHEQVGPGLCGRPALGIAATTIVIVYGLTGFEQFAYANFGDQFGNMKPG